MQSPQMLDSGWVVPPSLKLTTRIIWAALILGQLVFAAVICFVQPQAAPQPVPVQIALPISAAMLAAGVVAAVVVRSLRMSPSADEISLRKRYMLGLILPMAILEGASFVALVIVMINRSWWPMGVVSAVSLVVQLLLFPRAIVRR